MAEFFPDVPKIQYGGPKSRNPLDFKHYNADEVVDGKTMKEHLRFSVVYWHTFCNTLSDPFGVGTAFVRGTTAPTRSKTPSAGPGSAFEFFEKLGAPFYAFHDRDVAPEGKNLKESHANLDEIVKVLKDEQAAHGRQAALGHGQPLQQPPLHARGRHQPATSTSSPMPPPR